jgi:LPPG:FO 2-phospho-L-lactate transferase
VKTGQHVVALCGGVGGAKLAHGLSLVLPPQDLSIIVNTGDDFEHLGLYISPDLDSVTYALAGLSDPVRGWGRRDETWTFMSAIKQLNAAESWFQLGDGDLAMHVLRSRELACGVPLSQVTSNICKALNIAPAVMPMSDDPVRTRLLTEEGWLDFQEYFVHRQCKPVVQQLAYSGAQSAKPLPAALNDLQRNDLRAIVICPSNPFLSIEPILSLTPFRAALQTRKAPAVAVSPIVGGKALKGPAGKMLAELGLDVSPESVARRYAGLIDAFIVDETDPLPPAALDVTYLSAQTVMKTDEDRVALARIVLGAADKLHSAQTR